MSCTILAYITEADCPSGTHKQVRFQPQDAASSPVANTRIPTQPRTRRPLGIFACGVLLAIAFGCYMVNPVLRPRQEAEISPALRAYIDRAVSKAFRDPVGRRDFALHADGGRVLPELTKVAKGGGWTQPLSGSSPEHAITDDSRIGHCWSIPGSAAQLGIQLSEMIFPTHVSIDHIPVEIAADIGQAPRTVVLWGALDGSVNEFRRRHAFAIRVNTDPPVGYPDPDLQVRVIA